MHKTGMENRCLIMRIIDGERENDSDNVYQQNQDGEQVCDENHKS